MYTYVYVYICIRIHIQIISDYINIYIYICICMCFNKYVYVYIDGVYVYESRISTKPAAGFVAPASSSAACEPKRCPAARLAPGLTETFCLGLQQTPKSWNMDLRRFRLVFLLLWALGLGDSHISNFLVSTVPGRYLKGY